MDLANDFNKHFTTIDINSASNSDLNGACDHKTHAASNFVFAEISVDQVNEELKAIPANKASGLDSIQS